MIWALIFWVGVAMVLVPYGGYGIWIAWRAARRPRLVATAAVADADLPRVTCVMAARNEAAHIDDKLAAVLSQDYPPHKLTIIVVDDGSRDDTARRVKAWRQRDARIILIRQRVSRGKPTALNAARQAIKSEVAVYMDVRQRLSDGALRELVAYLRDPSIGVVSGNFQLPADAYWRYEKRLREWESRSGSMVQVTGALYALRTRDIPFIPPATILDDMYVPLTIAMTGRRIVLAEGAGCIDVPTRSATSEFVRKVRTLAGLIQLCHLLDGCLDPRRNPVLGRLIVHKFFRLASPYGLAMALAGSLMAPGRLYQVAAAMLISGLAAAAVPSLGLRAKIFRAAQSFVTLHAAAVWALPSYYVGWTSVVWQRVETERRV